MSNNSNSATCKNIISIYDENNPSHGIHWHDDYEVILVLEGEVNLQINFSDISLKQNESMVIASGEAHKIYSQDAKTKVFFIMLNKENCYSLSPNLYEALALTNYLEGYENLNESKDLILSDISQITGLMFERNMNNEYDIPLLNKKILNLINHIIYMYTSRIQPSTISKNISQERLDMIYRMIKYIYANFHRKVNLQELAELEYLSLYHLSRIIKEVTDMNFREWLNYVRVEFSEKLLLSTDKSIATISEECGFSDVRYFNKHFLKWYKVSPYAFRKAFKTSYTMNLGAENSSLAVKENTVVNLIKIIGKPPQVVSEKHKTQRIEMPISNTQSASIGKLERPLNFNCNFISFISKGFINSFQAIQKDIGLLKVNINLYPDEFNDLLSITKIKSFHANLKAVGKIGMYPTIRIYCISYNNEIVETIKKLFVPSNRTSSFKAMPMCTIQLIYEEDFSSKQTEEIFNNLSEFFCLKSKSIKIEEVFLNNELKKSTKAVSELSVKKFLHSQVNLYDLISKDGLKTPLYFYYLMISKLASSIFEESNHYIVTKESENVQVFLYNDKPQILANATLQFELSFKNMTSKYKLIHYQWTLELNAYNKFTSNPHIIPYLEESEMELFNMMSSPNVSFELFLGTENFILPIELRANSMHLLIFSNIDKK